MAAFSNEEGARYAPDMMGSLVHAGGISLAQALETVGTDGTLLSEELQRIGYAGSTPVGTIKPWAYLEIHIEQGPILEHENTNIGAVESLQGISWQEITIEGVANHAGTTPTGLRHDAGLCASRIATFLRDEIVGDSLTTVATVGNIRFFPNIINVIPSKAILTVDLRDPDENRLKEAELELSVYLKQLADSDRVSVSTRQLARFEPVIFDANLVKTIELVATEQQFSCRRMTSGAGHDAQMIARICPAAMIFVPSKDGISHNPREHTDETDLLQGFSVLLDLTRRLVSG